mgnify:CR=1 FL=1|jgi:CBS-domain-containing membrane protein|tara:strand:+ start:391 stop:561 length:171 start_codon:yes stop_codon:yes gene_type:complete
MKQKNVKFTVNENAPAAAFGKLIGVFVASIIIGFMMGIGIMLASWVIPLSARLLGT